MLKFNFKGITYKGEEGTKTINLYSNENNSAFTMFTIEEDLLNKNHLKNEVLKWNAINNIHDKLIDWMELNGLDDFVDEEYIDNLENQISGYREIEVLANVTNIEKRGNMLYIKADNLNKHIITDYRGKIIG
ncbi:MAG: hypothetical protein ACOC2W_02505 [bacterium]